VRRVGVWLAGFGFALLGIGLAVIILTVPAYTRMLSERFSLAEDAGLSQQAAADVAEQVRAFVVAGRGTLPATVGGRPGFDASAVSHLGDVRDVISRARLLSVALAAALTAWVVGTLRRKERARVAAALKAGGVLSVLLVAGAALVGVADFDAFFSAFHGVFFAAGTWTFPYDSLLIRLFPEPFWAVSGVAWGALVVVFGLGYWFAGVWLVREN